MWRCAVLFAFLVFHAAGRNPTDVTFGPWTAELQGPWRFHAGDDMKSAAPSFDDSSWTSLLNPGPVPRQNGTFWIRLHLRLGVISEPGLMLGPIADAYEVYWDGQRVGQFGELPPSTKWFTPRWRVFTLPMRLAIPGDHVIALRMWNGGLAWARQPPSLRPFNDRVGELSALHEAQSAGIMADFSPSLLQLLVSFAILLAGIYFLLLPRSLFEGPAFRWFGLLLAGRALNVLGAFYAANGPIEVRDWLLAGISGGMLTLSFVAEIEFPFALFRRRVPRLVRGIQLLLCLLLTILFAPRLFLVVEPFWRIAFWNGVMLASLIPIIVAAVEYGRHSRGAGVMLALFFVSAGASLMNVLALAYGVKVPTAFLLLGFRLWYWDVALLFWIPAMAIQIYKTNQHFRDERERLRGEMEAARQVQQLLLPSHAVQMPGFSIETAFHPAMEVGGDFFQLLPASNQALLIVVGDVSGKGMKAALLVSLIIGMLQNRKSDQPSMVLAELNAGLLGHSENGFTTCCCAALTADGKLMFANAGHLAPYLNQRELETAPGLPLGVTADVQWPETVIALQAGDRLIWISDGVLEARNSTGELLGFRRVEQLVIQSASDIAQAAQEFGQEDDITVVAITRK